MDDTILPTEWLYRVKAATRDLVRMAGGYVRAGEISGRGKSSVERWCSTDHVDVIPITAALLLQAETGAPLVTIAMAEIEGRQLTPKGSEPSGGGFLAAHVRVSKEAADYANAVARAQEDGVISPNEKAEIDREAAELAQAVADQRDTLAASGGHAIPLFGRRSA